MQEKKLTTPRMLGYGSGHFALGLTYTSLNLYLLYYYTDVLLIDPTVAGLIFMLPLIWDGITDPLMGMLATRTKSRFGSFRPYLLYGTPFLVLSFIGMFAAPLIFPTAVVAASFACHLLFRTLYTVVAIPYSSLMAVMTIDSRERGKLAGYKTSAGILAGLFTAALMLTVATYLEPENLQSGFLKVSLIYGILVIAFMFVTFTTSFELDFASAGRAQLTFKQTAQFLKKNYAFWLMCGGVLCGATGSSIGNKASVYYVSQNAGEPGWIAAVLSSGLIAAAIASPLWSMSYRYLAKRTVWLIGAGGYFILGGIAFLLGPTDIPTIMLFRVLDGICLSAIVVTYWSMLPDTVEFGEFRSGARDDGVIFGINQFALKCATGIGVGMLGIGLGAAGYVAQQEQTEQALTGIRALTFLGPMVGYGLSFVFIFFYPIDVTMHNRLVKALSWRQKRKMGPAII